jgi:hypothetical protein
MAGILKVDTIQNANADNIITQTNSTTLTIGTSGDTVTLAAGATSSGFGRSGTVNWDTTKKTTGFTAVSGVGYFCDTTSSAFTATLPSTPAAGDIVAFSDYTGTWGTNNLTIGRNGSNINAAAADLLLNGNNTTATFIYVDGTEGWRIIDTGSLSEVNIVAAFVAATGGTVTCCGNYKIHTFTGPGTFTVTSGGNPAGSSAVDYLVVAGGGGGGSNQIGNGGGAGGGAGGYRESKATGAPWTASPLASSTSLPVSVQSYPITVGGGGPGGTSPNRGTPGSNSVFSTITSAGGGGGGTGSPSAPQKNGDPGGSGGGGGSDGGTNLGGSGNTPPTSPSQGNNGGDNSTGEKGAGGGGAGGTGGSMTAPVVSTGPSGAGGSGATTSISGSPTTYAGGGGAGAFTGNTGGGGPGGSGGGGNGADFGNNGTTTGANGTANTGGGAGGGGMSPSVAGVGGTGGSGIVVIRYKYQ